MKNLRFFLLFALAVNNLTAQSSIVDSFKILETRVLVDSAKAEKLIATLIDRPDFKFLELRVDVIDLVDLDTLQTFLIDYKVGEKLITSLKLQDVNFDNLNDLVVLTNIGNSGNENFDFWVYNPIEKKYAFNKELTELLSSNPVINNSSKTYRTGGFLGCASMCWSFSTYKYINDELVKIMEETQQRTDSLDVKTGQLIFRRYKKIRKGDSLVTVKDITGVVMYIERN